MVYTSRDHGRYRLCETRVDGLSEPRQIFEDTAHDLWPLDVSGDGRWLLYGVGKANGNRPLGALWIRSRADAAPAHMLVPDAENFFSARFSPDGKWIAFDAEGSGRAEVYVSPMPPAPSGERTS